MASGFRTIDLCFEDRIHVELRDSLKIFLGVFSRGQGRSEHPEEEHPEGEHLELDHPGLEHPEVEHLGVFSPFKKKKNQ